jgi:hypothetical protein
MKKLIFLWFIIPGFISVAFGQGKTDDFKPHGKPLALIFTNFNTAFTDGETAPTFEITRAYLGYEYQFSQQWNAKVVLDVDDPEAGKHQLAAFLKNAYVEYGQGNFAASFGMIATTQFKVSEKIWGLRYLEKSFQDAYKFNSSADIGFNIDYQFADFMSADFSVINGEGYKNLQSDEFLRPGFGVTANPAKQITARVFVDYMGKDTVQQSLATFLAYADKRLVLGAEYNYQRNYDMMDGQDIYGTSFYATYMPTEKVKFLARFDDLRSKTPKGKTENWNLNKDGQLMIAGVELNPVKGVKIAPNLRVWNPARESSPSTTYVYLNLELKF